jgi:hypothetical protein
MCEAVASSREHVPPKCLFPETKDIGDLNLRKNLITVPSCDQHNSEKSKDDEYLLLGLTLNIINNGTALRHLQTKIRRTLVRNPMLMRHFRTKKQIIAVNREGTAFNTLMVETDNRRFLTSLQRVALGLFHHKFGERLLGTCTVLPDFMLVAGAEGDHGFNEQTNIALGVIKPAFESIECAGENPEVFAYAFMAPDNNGWIAARMRFFGGSNAYVAYVPDAA